MSTTIKISRETKELLTDVLIRLEGELGRRLSYDDVIRILIKRSRVRDSRLLLRLVEMKVSGKLVEKARKLLEEETALEEEMFRRRYRTRYEHTG
ncbi:MAG: hypothetical protein DRJ47_08360 [Thermoprotei archaeon]|nr:MAG: hypothetical protein DRJ47_08360 [Thermoprotei archaeon]